MVRRGRESSLYKSVAIASHRMHMWPFFSEERHRKLDYIVERRKYI